MALGTKMVVLMACINIVCLFAIPNFMAGDYMLDFLGINTSQIQGYNNATNSTASSSGEITIDNTTYSGIQATGQATNIVTGSLGFISDYIRIAQFVGTLFSILYAPAVLLATLQAPIGITLLIGGVWTIMYVIAILGFIRGRDF
jgi:hypothetical protein